MIESKASLDEIEVWVVHSEQIVAGCHAGPPSRTMVVVLEHSEQPFCAARP